MFEPCDMQALKDNGWRCNIGLGKVPDKVQYDIEGCKRYLTMASEKVRDEDKDNFEDVKQIEISLSVKKGDGSTSEPIKRCYKDELFTDKGWCKLKKPKSEMDWGFCDTSCQHALVIILFTPLQK